MCANINIDIIITKYTDDIDLTAITSCFPQARLF